MKRSKKTGFEIVCVSNNGSPGHFVRHATAADIAQARRSPTGEFHKDDRAYFVTSGSRIWSKWGLR
jgi:hypothetical protein